jgi:hypothetical protein
MSVTKQEFIEGTLKLGMSGSIPPLSLYAFMPLTGKNLLYLYHWVTTVTIDC